MQNVTLLFMLHSIVGLWHMVKTDAYKLLFLINTNIRLNYLRLRLPDLK